MSTRLVSIRCLGIEWHFEVATEPTEDGWSATGKVARQGLLAAQGAASEEDAIEHWKAAACAELEEAQGEAARQFPPE